MTAITVTLSGSTGTAALAVKVLTGAAASQPGAVVSDTTAASAAITPAGNGSLVYGAYQTLIGSGASYPYSVTGATQVISDAANGSARQAVNLRSTATTTAGTPVTLGVIAEGGEDSFSLALCEILASGTLAEDASSPATVPLSGASTMTPVSSLTTASFSPPAGALLVAMGSTGSGTPTLSDSSGLTWTKQASAVVSFVSAAVWTAQLASGGGGGTTYSSYPSGTPHSGSEGNTFTGTDTNANVGEPNALGVLPLGTPYGLA